MHFARLKRREFITLLGGAAVARPLAARAQQGSKSWRIGMLDTASRKLNEANVAAFNKGLRQLGHVEGQNLIIEYRSAEGRNERLPGLVSELLHLKIDIIVLRGTSEALAVKNATTAIPVVMSAVGDPVGSGVVSSLARPGGNITGLSSFVPELETKRLELLREIVPGMKRMGGLRDFRNTGYAISWKQVQTAAQSLAIEVHDFDVRNAEDIRRAFELATRERVAAIIVGIDGVTRGNDRLIAELAASNKLPTIYPAREFADDGGLMAFGVSYPHLYFRAATFVDKIFKGAKPADLPVEQPTELELVINLRTAKALGLDLPATVLARANEVIE
jgi:putative tryptophan/tyrosine transport system substrate-binding protein